MKTKLMIILLVFFTGYTFAQTSYSTFTDNRDGESYKATKVVLTNSEGKKVEQEWMLEDLRYKTPKSLDLEGKLPNGTKAGRLYLWEEAASVCPKGWKLPEKSDWGMLIEKYGGKSVAGKSLKASCFDGDNKGGFGILLSGNVYKGKLDLVGNSGQYFSNTESQYSGIVHTILFQKYADRAEASLLQSKYYAAVRCIKGKNVGSTSESYINPKGVSSVGVTKVRGPNTFICIDDDFNELFQVKALRVEPFSHGWAICYYSNANVMYYNKKGEILLERKIKKAQKFMNDVTWVIFSGDDNYSLINNEGDVLIENKYPKVTTFKENVNVCFVYNSKKEIALINKLGEVVIPFGKIIRVQTGDLKNGFCNVQNHKNKWAYLNAKGEFITDFKYDILFARFSEGLCKVKSNNMVGYIDTTGKEVIPLKYDRSIYINSDFINGVATVQKKVNGKYQASMINKKGEIVFTTKKGYIVKSDYDGMIRLNVKNGGSKYGWVDFNDNWIIPPKYCCTLGIGFESQGKEFPYSIAALAFDNKEYIIDTKGNIVFGPVEGNAIFSVVKDYNFGAIHVSKGEIDTYYTLGFKKISHPDGIKLIRGRQFDSYLPFKTNNKLWGYLDSEGKTVMEPTLKKADVFREGLSWIQK